MLIDAVRRAAAKLGRPIRLTMMGDGPARGEWEARARSLNVPCTFTGWIRGDDRWKALRTASVVALPSVWPEPFGLVGLEAGALGVPAIAFGSGGITEWLRPSVNGVVVPSPPSSEWFGDALASLLGDRSRLATLRIGAHRVAKEMSLTAHVDRLDAILRGVELVTPAVVTSSVAS
jgi:glycosyltransferase involved in cell wall biosynthesis